MPEYDVLIVASDSAENTYVVDHDVRCVTYYYTGDVADLTLMAQRAGECIAKRRLVPVLDLPTE